MKVQLKPIFTGAGHEGEFVGKATVIVDSKPWATLEVLDWGGGVILSIHKEAPKRDSKIFKHINTFNPSENSSLFTDRENAEMVLASVFQVNMLKLLSNSRKVS